MAAFLHHSFYVWEEFCTPKLEVIFSTLNKICISEQQTENSKLGLKQIDQGQISTAKR